MVYIQSLRNCPIDHDRLDRQLNDASVQIDELLDRKFRFVKVFYVFSVFSNIFRSSMIELHAEVQHISDGMMPHIRDS